MIPFIKQATVFCLFALGHFSPLVSATVNFRIDVVNFGSHFRREQALSTQLNRLSLANHQQASTLRLGVIPEQSSSLQATCDQNLKEIEEKSDNYDAHLVKAKMESINELQEQSSSGLFMGTSGLDLSNLPPGEFHGSKASTPVGTPRHGSESPEAPTRLTRRISIKAARSLNGGRLKARQTQEQAITSDRISPQSFSVPSLNLQPLVSPVRSKRPSLSGTLGYHPGQVVGSVNASFDGGKNNQMFAVIHTGSGTSVKIYTLGGGFVGIFRNEKRMFTSYMFEPGDNVDDEEEASVRLRRTIGITLNSVIEGDTVIAFIPDLKQVTVLDVKASYLKLKGNIISWSEFLNLLPGNHVVATAIAAKDSPTAKSTNAWGHLGPRRPSSLRTSRNPSTQTSPKTSPHGPDDQETTSTSGPESERSNSDG